MRNLSILIVRQPEHGMALDRFLALRLAISRKQAKRLLDDRLVFVNRRRVWMAHHTLRSGDEIELAQPTAPAPRTPASLRILYEDASCIVVDKPAGLTSVGPDSVESRLRAQYPEIQPVHRLDRDTSGCLMFARSNAARLSLENQFESRAIEKIYRGIAIGAVPDTLKRIEKPIDGLMAITEIRVIRRTPVASLIEARPQTGRTHQIRIHLQMAGFPLAGDRAYATRAIREDALLHIPRQMLHAWRIAWRDPTTGEYRKAQAAPPADFRETLVALGLSTPR